MAGNQGKGTIFDLDGTLLPLDVDVFMKSYFRALGGYEALTCRTIT